MQSPRRLNLGHLQITEAEPKTLKDSLGEKVVTSRDISNQQQKQIQIVSKGSVFYFSVLYFFI